MSFDSQDSVFEQLIPFVLKTEGGAKIVNHAKDPGGKTKYGISANNNQDALKKLGVTDVKDLTEDQAKQIYFDKYYMASGANELEDNALALIHLDAAINHGVGAAKEMLSRLSRNPAYFAGGGLNKGLFNALINEYTAQRLARYAQDRNAETFLEGWVNRMVKVLNAVHQLQVNPEGRLA